MQDAMELQPCIEKVEVTINRDMLKKIENEYDYASLNGNMLDVKVVSVFDDSKAIIRMKYIAELDYPLMYVEKID
jgi:hypothetical protein